MRGLFEKPLSVTTIGKMEVVVYPQLILISRGGKSMRYSGYSKTDAIRLFRKYYKEATQS